MRRKSRLLLLGIVGTMLLSLGAGTTSGARPSTPRGHLVRIWNAGTEAQPGWAKVAARHARGHIQVGRNTGLRVRQVVADHLGMTHVRFDQLHKGVSVLGGQVIAHLDSSGRLMSRTNGLRTGINLSVRPSLSRAAAVRAARRALGYKGRFVQSPTANLTVLKVGKRFVLAFRVPLYIQDGTDATAHHEYFINARTGKVAYHFDSLAHEDAVGTGNSLYSGQVSINTDLQGSTYRMIDNTRGGLNTTDLNNLVVGSGTLFTDPDNTWGNGLPSNDQSAGVDAHFGAEQTWDYYLNVHGREGIDGNGYTMRSRTHYGVLYANAFWDGVQMTYGDGDNITFRPLVSVDVAGHEITHGLTEFTANLIYEKEPGALNESFSDIFGSAVEFYTGPRAGHEPDYFIGEDIYIPADEDPGFRNMADPLEDDDPDNYAIRLYPGNCTPNPLNDNCGVHSNSGIQNNAYYLLSEGGTNRTSGISVPGIGRDKAEAIFFRALTVYLTPSSKFRQARIATLRASNDLFPGPAPGQPSEETRVVNKTWRAVGVQ